jgi:phage tail protein X
MERRELEGFLAAVIRTPAGEVHANHPLCQSVEVSDKGMKIRVPDKAAAAAQLARLSGWDAAQRVSLEADNPLTAYLRALRAKAIDGEVVQPMPIDNQ